MYIDNIGHIVRCKPYYADIMQYDITHTSKSDIVLCMSYGVSIGIGNISVSIGNINYMYELRYQYWSWQYQQYQIYRVLQTILCRYYVGII